MGTEGLFLVSEQEVQEVDLLQDGDGILILEDGDEILCFAPLVLDLRDPAVSDTDPD